MDSKFLDPKNDTAFKRIFGSENNKDILIHFLNDMIVFPEGRRIQKVSFLKTTQDPETAAQKASLLDILCEDEKGSFYIVEMQVAKDKGFEKRAQYYASKVYSSQMLRGQNFQELKEVIFLAIVDFVMFPNKKEYKSDHVILDRKSYENDLKDFSFTFVELPKFEREIDELVNITEKWVYFFKHASVTSEEALPKLIGEDQVIERAYQELNRYQWDATALRIYDHTDMDIKVRKGQFEQKLDEGIEIGEARGIEKGKAQGIVEGRAQGMEEGKVQGIVEGRAQGIEEGKVQGIVEGRAQGIEEGKVQGVAEGKAQGIEEGKAQGIEEEREKIIGNMLAQDIPNATICALTGLSLEAIEQVKARCLNPTP